MENKQLKLNRHESFIIREGWIEKALNEINGGDRVFYKNEGIKNLGIGSNMVKSLKYWMTSAGIIQKQNSLLTNFGDKLYNKDSLLEDIFSWCLIYYNLVTDFDDCPILNVIFNKCPKIFDKDICFAISKEEFSKKNLKFNEDFLNDDFSVAIRTLYSAITDINPENNYYCPISNIGLIKKIDNDHFEKIIPEKSCLNFLVVYLCLVDCTKDMNTFQLDDLDEFDNNPYQIFNLDRDMLFMYLTEMENHNLIRIIRTAGLNTIYFIRKMNELEIMDYYYKNGEEHAIK